MRRLLLLLALAAGGLAATTAPAAPVPVLKISFPEGWSAGQMADRAAEVRQIAIKKRGVTPLLSGSSYAAATRAAKVPAPFRPFLKRRSVEGFLFPSTYFFEPSSSATSLVARQIETFRQRWASVDLRAAKARKQSPYDVLIIASLIEKETVAPERARSRGRCDRQPARAGHAVGDRRLPALRPRRGGHPAAQAVAPAQQHAVQHPPLQGLPPTPITNPGLPSMRAAAKPAQVDYLYYVRKPDGVHHFFTADEDEFCAKAVEYGYPGC